MKEEIEMAKCVYCLEEMQQASGFWVCKKVGCPNFSLLQVDILSCNES